MIIKLWLLDGPFWPRFPPRECFAVVTSDESTKLDAFYKREDKNLLRSLNFILKFASILTEIFLLTIEGIDEIVDGFTHTVHIQYTGTVSSIICICKILLIAIICTLYHTYAAWNYWYRSISIPMKCMAFKPMMNNLAWRNQNRGAWSFSSVTSDRLVCKVSVQEKNGAKPTARTILVLGVRIIWAHTHNYMSWDLDSCYKASVLWHCIHRLSWKHLFWRLPTVGGTGFVGRAFIAAATRQGHKIISLSRRGKLPGRCLNTHMWSGVDGENHKVKGTPKPYMHYLLLYNPFSPWVIRWMTLRYTPSIRRNRWWRPCRMGYWRRDETRIDPTAGRQPPWDQCMLPLHGYVKY